ncbi:MAG: hypothetical protein AAF654_15230 [Myxococcota bacterium]
MRTLSLSDGGLALLVAGGTAIDIPGGVLVCGLGKSVEVPVRPDGSVRRELVGALFHDGLLIDADSLNPVYTSNGFSIDTLPGDWLPARRGRTLVIGVPGQVHGEFPFDGWCPRVNLNKQENEAGRTFIAPLTEALVDGYYDLVVSPPMLLQSSLSSWELRRHLRIVPRCLRPGGRYLAALDVWDSVDAHLDTNVTWCRTRGELYRHAPDSSGVERFVWFTRDRIQEFAPDARIETDHEGGTWLIIQSPA